MEEYKVITISLYHVDFESEIGIEFDTMEKKSSEDYIKGIIKKAFIIKTQDYLELNEIQLKLSLR
ncbi:hypothetical protein [Clostridium algidicarnis]|uniref:hypothetical protein n=1 Tax=Clostridium algidicarnis TaxID=37659 RepID=UPI0016261B13|nr:hypothetical protein [Clostridium algidicarnis]MBB6696236.1 hypothetical protein [Clostridium algidicarnis]